MEPDPLNGAIPNPNLTRKQLGEALLSIVEELLVDYTRINPEDDSGVVYAEPLISYVQWLFGLEGASSSSS